jgi:hypothetical protein
MGPCRYFKIQAASLTTLVDGSAAPASGGLQISAAGVMPGCLHPWPGWN